MYQCSTCGSDNPNHVCPGPDVKSDVEARTEVRTDIRADHLRRHDETQQQFRLRRILELQQEGLTQTDIGADIGISGESVRSILRKNRLQELDRPLKSSLKDSLTNHTPSDADLERIKEIRHKADELCELIDRYCLDRRETSLAKTHLEETTMWAVKSIMLPRKAEGGASLNTAIFSAAMFKEALAHRVIGVDLAWDPNHMG